MKILEQKFTPPTSIVENYPEFLLWRDASFACICVHADNCTDQTKTLKRAFNSAAR
jgi:hypothetical protein